MGVLYEWIARICAAAVMLASGLWFFGGAPRSGAYPIDIATAETRLRQMDFDEAMLNGMDFDLTSDGDGDGRALRWSIGSTLEPRIPKTICRVVLVAEGPDETSSSLDCTPVHDKPDRKAEKRVHELVELVMAEHVDATLGDRPFDHERMGRALYAFALAAQPMIQRRSNSQSDRDEDMAGGAVSLMQTRL